MNNSHKEDEDEIDEEDDDQDSGIIEEDVDDRPWDKSDSWHNDPASDKQMEYLAILGVKHSDYCNLTKIQASELIDEKKADRELNEVKFKIYAYIIAALIVFAFAVWIKWF